MYVVLKKRLSHFVYIGLEQKFVAVFKRISMTIFGYL